jgi:predicted amidohydrolase YtcJ
VAAGVRVVTGSDHPIETLSPLVGLQRLATGADIEEGSEPVATALPLDDALGLMTDAAAGTTVLDADPRRVALEELHELKVEATLPGGVPALIEEER